MKNIILLLLGVLFSTIESQISLTPGQTCEPQNTISSAVVDIVTLKIVGGHDISAEDVPWHAVLELKNKSTPNEIVNHCGGSIVSQSVVLVAAHCVWSNEPKCPEHIRNQASARECHKLPGGCPTGCGRVRPKDLNVYVGVTSINQSDRTPLKVKSIIVHPGWSKSSLDTDNLKLGHDLAMVVLETELQFNSKVRPVCIPDNKLVLPSGGDVSVHGFGITASWILAQRLQQGFLQILAKDNCTGDYATLKEELLGDQLCAFSANTDSCGGDSGGGLIASVGSAPVLVGIVSFGALECRNLPGVYTNVQSHVEWIQQKFTDITANNGPIPAGDLPCSPQQPCSKGEGDCQTDQDCGHGLFCGKNNCWGEFGFSPQGSRKDDCCTDHLNYCSPADLLPRSRTTCCSPDTPCPAGHGDCDTDSDCESGLKCGNNNCKKLHPFADENDDCCVDPNPSPPPSWSRCSSESPCGVREGDCGDDDTCAGDLICGSNNCRQFHPGADPRMDCCVQKI